MVYKLVDRATSPASPTDGFYTLARGLTQCTLYITAYNGLAPDAPPVLPNINTTSALIAALDTAHSVQLGSYLHEALVSSLTIDMSSLMTALARNISSASPLFKVTYPSVRMEIFFRV